MFVKNGKTLHNGILDEKLEHQRPLLLSPTTIIIIIIIIGFPCRRPVYSQVPVNYFRRKVGLWVFLVGLLMDSWMEGQNLTLQRHTGGLVFEGKCLGQVKHLSLIHI